MNQGALAFETFPGKAGPEWMMRIGAAEVPAILFVPPLFEEMNRTRALIADVMQRLAALGHGCWLPDLSGTGESLRALGDVHWSDWRHDVTAASAYVSERAGQPLIASLRGGTLLDDAATGRGWWRLVPSDGAALTRDMVRAGLAGVEWAGYVPSDDLKADLAAATPSPVAPLRIVRLSTDRGEADGRLYGPALWRRSEPGFSAELAEAMAADIYGWSRSCAG
ncbi:hypothetical protein [Sphingosinicella sp.]|uniref:hypothetical protein n=1 Tax=Sphingosinicella sp. TaxID=1917971 RepID=UPI0040377548